MPALAQPQQMQPPLGLTPEAFADRAFVRTCKDAPVEPKAVRTLFKAYLVLIARLREANCLLGARLARLPERRRPHYTPVERFRIVSLKEQMGLTNDETADLFHICGATVSRGMSRADPASQPVGSLVKPIPPIRRYDDATHHLVQNLAGVGLGGYQKLVDWLGLVAIRISSSAVRRYLKGPRLPKPVPPVKASRAVVANFVHHVTHIDSTWLKDFLGATPAEIYFGVEPAHRRAVQPARGKLAAPCAAHHVAVANLNGDQRFPYLKPAA